jgi:NTE family protein
MEVKDFTEQVFHLVENLKEHIRQRDKQFSDIIDDDNHQYVDVVMEGGGVLGIALVGFTYVLEQAGIRFLQIGGASAGAINALLLAALGTPAEVKSEKILEELANVNMYDFVDGDSDARDFIESWLSDAGKLKIGFKLIQILDNINEDLGLNPGEVFHKWMKDILKNSGIKNTCDLLDRLDKLPPTLKHREGKSLANRTAGLALVAADVSTQTKAVFPKMAELYWKNPDAVNPADYVRASMSIPYFFHPFRVNKIPSGERAMVLWKQYADYELTPPKSCAFIDGGIMSNFPINLFHRPDRVPTAPTFGVKLGTDERKTEDITKPFTLAAVIFDAARFNLDADFIARNQDYRKLVSCIGTGDHHWLKFDMSDAEKIDLFVRGAKEADRFLREFDWHEYKKIRESIAQSIKDSNLPQAMMSGDAVPTTIKKV